jgi:hypothetical protein
MPPPASALVELLREIRPVELKNGSVHKLRRASLDELKRLERETIVTQRIAKDGTRRSEGSGVAGIRNHYDSLVISIANYEELEQPVNFGHEDFSQILKSVPIQDKLEAVNLFYDGDAWIAGRKASLSNPTVTVTLEFPNPRAVLSAVEPQPAADEETLLKKLRVGFILRKPSETDLKKYSKAFIRSFRDGRNEGTASVSVDVEAVVGLFDAMYQRPADCEDAGNVLNDLDPTWKRMVVDALFAGEQAELGD